jgi:Fic family protein
LGTKLKLYLKGGTATDFKGSEKTIKEIENHTELCDNLLKICKENNSRLSITLIKQIHHTLMKGCFAEELLYKGEKPDEFKNEYVKYIG